MSDGPTHKPAAAFIGKWTGSTFLVNDGEAILNLDIQPDRTTLVGEFTVMSIADPPVRLHSGEFTGNLQHLEGNDFRFLGKGNGVFSGFDMPFEIMLLSETTDNPAIKALSGNIGAGGPEMSMNIMVEVESSSA